MSTWDELTRGNCKTIYVFLSHPVDAKKIIDDAALTWKRKLAAIGGRGDSSWCTEGRKVRVEPEGSHRCSRSAHRRKLSRHMEPWDEFKRETATVSERIERHATCSKRQKWVLQRLGGTLSRVRPSVRSPVPSLDPSVHRLFISELHFACYVFFFSFDQYCIFL